MLRVFATTLLLVLAAAAAAPAARAESLDGVLARAKAAAGGDAVDRIAGLKGEGTVATGGLTGKFDSLSDVRRGRTVVHYDLGPVSGANGDDGRARWALGAGGEVQVLDSAAAQAETANTRWLASLAYWYPQRHAGTMELLGERSDAGHRYHVIEAVPAGGRAIELWFDADTSHLTRTVSKNGQVVTTTSFGDFREVDGVTLPFAQRDGSGEARYDTAIAYTSLVAVTSVDDAAFAAPEQKLADFAIAGGAAVAAIPFQLINNHIYVDATVNGQPVHMLVDTGGANILTPRATQRLGVKAEGALEGRGVGEQTTDVGLVKLDRVGIGAVSLQQPVFYTIDLDFLRDVEGHDMDGILGFEVFSRFVVEIAYDERELRLHDPKRWQADPKLAWSDIKFEGTTPVVAATLDGIAGEFTLDTGSRAALTMHSPFVRAHDLVARFQAGGERINGWGVGGPMRSRPAVLPGLVLGGHRIASLHGDVYTGSTGAFAREDEAGNIGGGVLRRFTVTFDYGRRRVAFVPNADFAAADAGDRSGLWLNRDGEGYVVIECVAGSPCDKAGLRAKDRIVAVDGRAAGQMPLADTRALLRGAAGTEVVLRYARRGKEATATVTLAE